MINEVDMLDKIPDPNANIRRGDFALKWLIVLSMLRTLFSLILLTIFMIDRVGSSTLFSSVFYGEEGSVEADSISKFLQF